MERLPKKKHCKYFHACEYLYLFQVLNFRVVSKATATSMGKAVKSCHKEHHFECNRISRYSSKFLPNSLLYLKHN